MLKIKNEVDLKELKKFGFQWDGDTFYECYSGTYRDLLLDVRIINREISIYDFSDETLDILFDLIQAGLGEKWRGRDEK